MPLSAGVCRHVCPAPNLCDCLIPHGDPSLSPSLLRNSSHNVGASRPGSPLLFPRNPFLRIYFNLCPPWLPLELAQASSCGGGCVGWERSGDQEGARASQLPQRVEEWGWDATIKLESKQPPLLLVLKQSAPDTQVTAGPALSQLRSPSKVISTQT